MASGQRLTVCGGCRKWASLPARLFQASTNRWITICDYCGRPWKPIRLWFPDAPPERKRAAVPAPQLEQLREQAPDVCVDDDEC